MSVASSKNPLASSRSPLASSKNPLASSQTPLASSKNPLPTLLPCILWRVLFPHILRQALLTVLVSLTKFYLRLRFHKNQLLILFWTSFIIIAPSFVIEKLWHWSRFRNIPLNGEKMRIRRMNCFGQVPQTLPSTLDLMRLSCYLSCFDWQLSQLTGMCGLLFGDEYTRRLIICLSAPDSSEVTYILHVLLKSSEEKGAGPQYQLLKAGENPQEWHDPMFGKVQYIEPAPPADTSSIDELEALLGE